MTNRRRTRRFIVREQVVCSLRIVQEVDVERRSAEEVTIVAADPFPLGEPALLRTLNEDGAPSSFRVRAVERQAVVVAGRVLQRVRLQMVRSGAGDAAALSDPK